MSERHWANDPRAPALRPSNNGAHLRTPLNRSSREGWDDEWLQVGEALAVASAGAVERWRRQAPWRARVRAALRAAAARPCGPFVCTAFRAAAERWAAVRRRCVVLA